MTPPPRDQWNGAGKNRSAGNDSTTTAADTAPVRPAEEPVARSASGTARPRSSPSRKRLTTISPYSTASPNPRAVMMSRANTFTGKYRVGSPSTTMAPVMLTRPIASGSTQAKAKPNTSRSTTATSGMPINSDRMRSRRLCSSA